MVYGIIHVVFIVAYICMLLLETTANRKREFSIPDLNVCKIYHAD